MEEVAQPGEDDSSGTPHEPGASAPGRRPRTALWIAASLAVVVALLVGVLATRKPAVTRIQQSPLVGRVAPETSATSLSGDRYSLADHRGEWVLVNFFATWCIPCREEHDDLVRFANAHAIAGDATVVTIIFSDEVTAVRRFFAQNGGTWPVLPDDGGQLATAWGVARVPESYLVAPSGYVVGKITGGVTYDFLERQLEKLETRATRGQ